MRFSTFRSHFGDLPDNFFALETPSRGSHSEGFQAVFRGGGRNSAAQIAIHLAIRFLGNGTTPLQHRSGKHGCGQCDSTRTPAAPRSSTIPLVAADAAYQNAKKNTPHTARMAHDQALSKVMQHLLKDDTQVYKQFVENESFKRFIGDMVYALTNE